MNNPVAMSNPKCPDYCSKYDRPQRNQGPSEHGWFSTPISQRHTLKYLQTNDDVCHNRQAQR